MIHFDVFENPVAKGRPRVTKRGIAYTPKRTAQAEARFRNAIEKWIPLEPLSGPLWVFIDFHLPVPKSWPKWKKEAARMGMVVPVKPDIDNLAKLPLDALTRSRFWHDDSQITELRCQKQYAPNEPYTSVSILSLPHVTTYQEYLECVEQSSSSAS